VTVEPANVGATDRATDRAADRRRRIPCGYADWWSMDLRLWWRDFDGYEHLTATAYPVIYAEAIGQFIADVWGVPDPHFVVADLGVSYLREVRRADGPVRVHVGIARVGRSSFEAEIVLCTARGEVASVAETRYFAWDPDGRRSRPLTSAERSALLTR
jgi:acyl-CoA thioesterase FadM